MRIAFFKKNFSLRCFFCFGAGVVLLAASAQAQPGDAEALERAKALVSSPVMPEQAEPSEVIDVPPKPLLESVDAALETLQEEEAGLSEAAPVPESIPAPELTALEAAPAAQVKPVDSVPAPDPAALEQPESAVPGALEAARPDPAPTAPAPLISEAAQTGEFDENLFFDAEALVPESEISKKSAPSKVNPALNPGSVLVVSTQTASANSKEAQLVAAERARKLGRHESALQIYDALYTKNRRDPNVLIGRAATLQSLGRNDEAIRAYEEFLKLRPDDLHAQVNLQGLIGRHYPAVALRTLRDLYENNPGEVAVVAQVAVIEAQLGNYEEAVRYLGMAASMEPENAGHLFNLAVIADKSGDKASAIQYYEEALEADTLYGAGRSIPREAVFERLAQIR